MSGGGRNIGPCDKKSCRRPARPRIAAALEAHQNTRLQQDAEEFTYRWGAVACEVATGRTLASKPDGCRGDRPSSPPADKSVALALLTAMFLHGSIDHLAGNMLFLWVFGSTVEDRLGRLNYLGLYLLGGMVATLGYVAFNVQSPIPLIGASGAIAGVMGAYLVMYPRARIILLVPLLFWPLFFTVPALVFLGYWFVIQVLSGGLGLAANTAEPGGIAFGAHVGGFIAGVALHPLFVRRTPRRRQSDERSLESAWQPRGLS